jgi:hypothetical protein
MITVAGYDMEAKTDITKTDLQAVTRKSRYRGMITVAGYDAEAKTDH